MIRVSSVVRSLIGLRAASSTVVRDREHVPLHCDSSTVSAVGARRGTPVLLNVRAYDMVQEGFLFFVFVTANEVWLTDVVPPQFIEFPDDQIHPNDWFVTAGAEPLSAAVQRTVAYVSSRSSGFA